jgi:putative MATE family efflux protein
MLTAVLVGIAETYYIGRLGVEPLAANAMVFPFAMLAGMISAGALGGAIASAISRALGADDRRRAQTLAHQAVIIAVLAGLGYGGLLIGFGEPLYRSLGAQGAVLALALEFSNLLFIGAVLTFAMNGLAAILRAAGNMLLPSAVLLCCALLQISLGGGLAFGLGPLPRLGLRGVAIGQLVPALLGAAFLLWRLSRADSPIPLQWSSLRPERQASNAILRVAALGSLSSVLTVLAIVTITRLIAKLGVAELAGYGIGQRLEFMLIPISFGIGVASTSMVGAAIGAGRVDRARRVAWTAASVSAFNLGLVGLVAALTPEWWAHLFSHDTKVLSAAAQYFHWTGPAFAFFGFGLTLYFASQGSGRILGPVLAGVVRLAVIIGGGLLLREVHAEASGYFALVAAAMVSYGLSAGLSVYLTSWHDRSEPSVASAR